MGERGGVRQGDGGSIGYREWMQAIRGLCDVESADLGCVPPTSPQGVCGGPLV
jgi:hypothetical protein